MSGPGAYERALRLLLRGYSRAFRDRFGQDLVWTAGERLRRVRESRGRGAAGVEAVRTLVSMIGGAVSDRARGSAGARAGRPRRGGRMAGESSSARVALEDAVRTLRLSARGLRRRPGLAAGVVLAFAIGIGSNATIYRIVDRLLLSPPPHLSAPEDLRIVAVESYSEYLGERYASPIHAYPQLGDWRGASALGGIAGYDFAVRERTVGRGESALRLRTRGVTGEYMALLGVRPVVGRLIQPADDRVDAPRVVVLAEPVWRREYGGAPGALGRTIDLDGTPHEIIGVAPAGFTGVDLEPVDAWIPLTPYRAAIADDWDTNRTRFWLRIVVRLAPGASAAAAESELTTRYRVAFADRLADDRVARDPEVVLASVVPGRSPLRPVEADVARWLAGVSIALLLLAAVNVANLLISARVRERRITAIQRAMGASRGRLARAVAAETVLLAAAGGVAAVVVALLATGPLGRLLLPNLAWSSAGLVAEVAAVSLLLALGAGLVAGVLPSLFVARKGAGQDLLRSTVAPPDARRTRAVLLAAQAGLSVLLLVGAGLFVRSFGAAASQDLGIDLDGLHVVTLSSDATEEEEDEAEILRRALPGLRGHPAVHAAAASSTYPFYQRNGVPLRAEGWDTIPQMAVVTAVAGDYFEAAGLRARQGRLLGGGDIAGSPLVAVVNQTMADLYWGGDALGRCLYVGGDATACTRVVGVVEDARSGGIGTEPWPQYYLPADQQAPAGAPFLFLVRFRGEPGPGTLADLRRMLLRADPRIRFVEATPAAASLASRLRPWRLGATLFTAFGALALVLTAVGLYAALGFDVVQRWREIGIRAALGAPDARLFAAAITRSLTVAAAGAGTGAVAAFLLAPQLEGLLFQVRPRDPASFLLATAVLGAASLCAAAMPARRALRIDPAEVLKHDG